MLPPNGTPSSVVFLSSFLLQHERTADILQPADSFRWQEEVLANRGQSVH